MQKRKKEKKERKIKHFVLTKTTSFRFMSVRLIGRLKGGSVNRSVKRRFGLVAEQIFGTKFYTDC